MMVPDKFYMGKEGCKIIPFREGFGINHQAGTIIFQRVEVMASGAAPRSGN
jgi:hypothetical protein